MEKCGCIRRRSRTWRRSKGAACNSLDLRQACFRAVTKVWAGFGTWKKLRRGHWSCLLEGVKSGCMAGVKTMNYSVRKELKNDSFFRVPDWFRLPNWLTSQAPDFGQQATRIRAVERNIVMP